MTRRGDPVEEIIAVSSSRAVYQPAGVKAWLMPEVVSGSNVPDGLVEIIVGSESNRVIVETQTLEKLELVFPSSLLAQARQRRCALYVCHDFQAFNFALRLARECHPDPVMKRSKKAIGDVLRIARMYGLTQNLADLEDRFAVLQNLVMPEVAALLETNPRRKLLLLKSVVRRARLADAASGGAYGVQSKRARVRVAHNLIESCENSATILSETWKRKYLRTAEKILQEGSTELPKSLVEEIEGLRHSIDVIKSEKLTHSDEIAFSRADGRQFNKKKPNQSRVMCIPLGTGKKNRQSDFVTVNCSGQKSYLLHKEDVRRFSALDNCSTTVCEEYFVCDDPSRFELALRLVQSKGKLDDSEKSNEAILKSYREVARSYGLEWLICRRLETWIVAHKSGVGGARNIREEIRALKLTMLLNPEKGDIMVASTLAEALLDRVSNTIVSDHKKVRLLENAETNLRIVLPILLTSMSIAKISKEQQLAMNHSVSMLKQILNLQGRADDAANLDIAVESFLKGVRAAAKDLSTATRDIPSGMYA